MGNPNDKNSAKYYFKYQNSFVKKTPNLLICDARSKAAAMGNKLMGKGWENESYYINSKLTFHNIANLEGVRRSYAMINMKKN